MTGSQLDAYRPVPRASTPFPEGPRRSIDLNHRSDNGHRLPSMSTPRAPGQPSAPSQSPHKTLEALGGVSGLATIGGLILTIYTQKPEIVVPWALCVLGLSAIALIVPQVPRLAHVGIVAVIAVALISSSIVIFLDPRLLTHTTIRIVRGTGQTGSAFHTDIKLAPIAEPIPYCNEFLGTGTIPAGYELWIFDQVAGDPAAKYNLDSQAVAVGNSWSATNIEIGDGVGDTGNRMTIFAVLLPTSFMNWLLSTVNIAHGLSSSTLPAGAHIADQAVVTRSSDTMPCRY
jgi:hypothetical protein